MINTQIHSSNRSSWAFFLVGCLLTGWGSTWAAAAEPSPEDLAKWVRNLDADEFVVRQQATQKLLEAGTAALGPLADALPEGNLEVASRGVYVLGELALDKSPQTADSARDLLERLTTSENPLLASRATDSLTQLNELRRDSAISELQSLGAEIQRGFQQFGFAQRVDPIVRIEFGKKWEGENSDLRRLVYLDDIQQLTFNSPRIGDEGLRYLAKSRGVVNLDIKRASITDAGLAVLPQMKSLRVLSIYYTPVGNGCVKHLKELTSTNPIKLYGTKITEAAAEALQTALPNTVIDHRRGAFLGVGCQPDPRGCMVIHVHPNSAAHRADMRAQDVIVRYEDKVVEDFEGLTKLISENSASEEVTIEILRGDERLKKKIQLGEWD